MESAAAAVDGGSGGDVHTEVAAAAIESEPHCWTVVEIAISLC